MDAVKSHEDAWPFVEPVEEEYAPNYYTVVRRPMDLQTMEDRLDAGEYTTFTRFRQDFQLIVENCRLYNGPENEYTEMVDGLSKIFNNAAEKYIDQASSSDEDIGTKSETVKKRKKTPPPVVAPPEKRKPREKKVKNVKPQPKNIKNKKKAKSPSPIPSEKFETPEPEPQPVVKKHWKQLAKEKHLNKKETKTKSIKPEKKLEEENLKKKILNFKKRLKNLKKKIIYRMSNRKRKKRNSQKLLNP